jgi:hypothetical protein
MKLTSPLKCIFATFTLFSFSALASPAIESKIQIPAGMAFTQIVASLGTTGTMEGKLADLGSDCAVAVSKIRKTQDVEIELITSTSEITAVFAAGSQVTHIQTALSIEDQAEGYFQDTYISQDGKSKVVLSTSKSVVMMSSVETPTTKLTCGDF